MQRSLRRPGAVQSYACQIVRSYAAEGKVCVTTRRSFAIAVMQSGMSRQMASTRPPNDPFDCIFALHALSAGFMSARVHTCRVQEDIPICKSLESQPNQFRARLVTMHILQPEA